MPALETLGWDAAWAEVFEPHRLAGLAPGRVSAPHRGGSFDVLGSDGNVRARLPGRLRHEADSPADLPVVGDWVALARSVRGAPSIRAVLPRRTKLSRRAAGGGSGQAREQVVAANVDRVLVTASFADLPGPRLLERYVALVRESGASPVILLTKADLADMPERIPSDVARATAGGPVVAVSTRSGLGLERVRALVEPGVTAALLGPSGAGKSTLVNALAGEELLRTGRVAARGAGRHTTTGRQLVVLPGGGVVVDNPGIRELHLWVAEESLAEAFPEVAELAHSCRFADCRHETEPGCAVRAALADGTLSPERWDSYRELQREPAELAEQLARRERSRARRGRPGTGPS